MPLPAAVYELAKTIRGRQSILELTPSGASALLLLVDYLGDASQLTLGRTQGIGANNGPAFTANTYLQSRAEMFRFRTREIKKVLAFLGGLSFHKTGTATIYIRDPIDAANVVALASETAFPCSFYRDAAEIAYSPANPSEITVVVESHKDGEITWDDDAAIPV